MHHRVPTPLWDLPRTVKFAVVTYHTEYPAETGVFLSSCELCRRLDFPIIDLFDFVQCAQQFCKQFCCNFAPACRGEAGAGSLAPTEIRFLPF